MYIVIWEYQVKANRVAQFENIYSPNGAWMKLFQKSASFLETEFLRDEKQAHRYITIDRWTSSQDYESFLSQWKTEYETLDAQYEGLTEQEILLGKWESR